MPYKSADQQSQYQREWIAQRRLEWLAANGPCVKCGSWNDLEVDHVDPAKKVSHRVWSWAEPRRLAELAKCQVLCHDCHGEKTFGVCPNGHLIAGDNILLEKSGKRRCRVCRREKENWRMRERRRKGV